MTKTALKNRSCFADVINRRNLRNGLEVGVFRGEYSAYLLKHCPKLTLFCVDPWDGSGMRNPYQGDETYSDARSRLEKVGGERIVIVRESSPAAATCQQLQGQSFDFIYLDGDHTEDAVRNDILAWWPKLNVGGIMAGHDYNNRGWKRVRKAVDGIFTNVQATQERASWWVEKQTDEIHQH